MVTIINRPIMLYNLVLLGRMGFKRIFVSVHSLADRIENYFGDGQRWGVSLEYILQRDALGSAGALRWAKQLLKDHFIVMPADQIADLDLSQAIQQHLSQKATATVIVQPGVRQSSRSLQIEDGKYICAIGSDSPDTRSWTDTGVYIFDRSILEWIPPRQPFDIHQHLLPMLLAKGVQVQACSLPGYYNSLDTFQDYMEAQRVFLTKALKEKNVPDENVSYRYNSLESRQLSQGLWTGKNVRIHPSAKIWPLVTIGSNSWIGREAELGPNAVIGCNVVINQGVTIKDSIVLDATYIGKLLHLENRLVQEDLLVDPYSDTHIHVNDPVMLGKTYPGFIMSGFKRPLEFCLATLLFLLTLPVLLSLGVLLLFITGRVFTRVACSSPRLSRQKGHLHQSEPFDLLHFNTRNADDRPFWFGTWLESWEGQRLPELLNVLKGDLALVGLKPVVTEAEKRIREAWPMEQNQAQAGFTGQWYLESDEHSSLEDSLIADIYYLATVSRTQDWKILWQTPAAWFKKMRIKIEN
jgi:NDP-sugar pyrophosphorylase family protein